MPVLPALKFPHPVLLSPAKPVIQVDDEIRLLVDNMIETMYANPRCIGVAANQVGYSVRVFVMDVARKVGPKKNHGLVALINPVIIYKEGEKVGREGCLSLPEYLGNVKRARRVIVRGLDRDGKELEIVAKELEARAIQHEVDHLDGMLFIHRISSISTDLFSREVKL